MSLENAGSDLVRDLLRPEAYGTGSNEPVSLRTTHASWVFLAGDHAWKVKRPVNFGFLDFRTPEARRRACQDEVRLNRRLAPDIYLGVVPVLKTSRGYVFDADSEAVAVDWAVRMRRLPDDSSAAALRARGELDGAALEVLAERLAVFFASAASKPEFGTPTVLCLNVTENFMEVAPFVGDLLDQETLDEVEAFQMNLLTQHVERFVARVSEDRIREGHGDLRLEHVYFVPIPGGKPRPTIIDCIEFSERFRCGDAAAEVAFLAMELEAAGRPDLAAGFVARYAEASDDFGLYGVLDFYLSYRAWIRGKVAALLAADPTTTADLRAEKRAEAARDFRLARSFGGEPLQRPRLIVVGGVIGSGKSTLATALGRELALPIIGSDRTRKLTAGLEPTARGGTGLYNPAQTDRIYAEIIQRATGVLSSGRGAILDATFSSHRWRQAVADAARAANADFVFIEATCADRASLRARLAARRAGPSISDATDEQLDEFLRRYEPLSPSDPTPSFSIETSGPPGASLREALRRLESAGIVPAAAPQILRKPGVPQ